MDFIKEENRIFNADPDGKLLAEVTFPEISENTVNINHTFVDDSLRGQGIAGELMKAVAEELRKSGIKAVLSCSYAVSWFQKHEEYKDVLK